MPATPDVGTTLHDLQHHAEDSKASNSIIASSSSTTLESSNLGPMDDSYLLLRMEAATQNETRRLLGLLDVAFRLSLLALLAYLVLKWLPLDGSGTLFMCTTNFSVANLAVACVLLPAAAATAGVTLHRCVRSLAAHKQWTQRRRRLFGLYAAQLASATLGLSCYLASNLIVVAAAACDAPTRRVVYWLAFVRWSCFNTTCIVLLIKAHTTTIVPAAAAAAAAQQRWRRLLFLAWQPSVDVFGHQQMQDMQQQAEQQQQQQQHGASGLTPGPQPADIETGGAPAGVNASASPTGRLSGPPSAAQAAGQQQFGSSGRQRKQAPPDMLVLDLPWVYHYPKVLLWLLFEACHLGLAIGESLQSSSQGVCRALTDTCDLTSCWPSDWLIALLSSELALALLNYAVWVWLIARSSRLLHTRPWQALKVANLILRLERRLGGWAYSLIIVTSCVFWFGSLADCSRAAYVYYGLPTTEIMWAAISIIGMLFMQPTDPQQANPRTVVQLQQFSFTEAALGDCIKERNAAASRGGAAASKAAINIAQEPMFCFESAIKLFFFSSFVYSDYNAARDSAQAGGSVGVPEAELEQLVKAMALYKLNVHKVIYDDDNELKVLFAWNSDTVVVTFRGSTTAANWVADAMLWRSAHPGSTFKNQQSAWFNAPKIHTGFLRCWSGTGLDRRVLSMLTSLVETSLNPSKLKIYFTGHSLGGALATLSAFDLVQRCPQLDSLRQVSVYTFGAPRAGNRAFARVYERAVPDTWHVVNDQDTIPRGGKFISAYKRNGQRVVLNKLGDCVVRPTPLESSMLQVAWGSNPLHHLLASYQASLSAVALAQLDQLKSLPGGPDGLLALINDCPIVAEAMYQHGSDQNLILWLGGRVWFTLASRVPRELLNTSRLVMPAAGGEAAAAAAARRAAARQRRSELQQLRRQQQRERQQRRQEQQQQQRRQQQLRRQGALAASTALDAFDLETGLQQGPDAAGGAGPVMPALNSSSSSHEAAAVSGAFTTPLGRHWQQQQQLKQRGPLAAVGRAAWWLSGGLIGTAAVPPATDAFLRQQQQRQQMAARLARAVPATPAALDAAAGGLGQQQQQQQPVTEQPEGQSGAPAVPAAPAAAGSSSGGAAIGADSEAVSHMLGYLTGMLPAWPQEAPAAGGHLQQQQQHGGRQDQQQRQPAAATGGSLLRLSGSSSSLRMGGDEGEDSDSAEFWDAVQSQHSTPGQLSSASSCSVYFDTAGPPGQSPDVQSLPSQAHGEASGQPHYAAAAAAAAAAVAAMSSTTTTCAPAAPAAAAPVSPFAAAAAAAPADLLSADSSADKGPLQHTPTQSLLPLPEHTASSAAGPPLAGSQQQLSELEASAPQQQHAADEASSLLAAGSLADALDRVPGAVPVCSLGPARTAPQALFNPAAALVGVRQSHDSGDEGTIAGFISRVVGGGSGTAGGGGSSSTPRAPAAAAAGAAAGTAQSSSSPSRGPAAAGAGGPSPAAGGGGGGGGTADVRSTARGVLGMLGLKSPGHSAAGTLVDTAAGGSDSSSSRASRHYYHRAGRLLKALVPGGGGSNSSSGASGGGSGDNKTPGSSSEAVEQPLVLFSLDVRRLSLASPLLPGSQLGPGAGGGAAVLETQVHLPVVQEGDGDHEGGGKQQEQQQQPV